MSDNTYILVDKDYDQREANGDTEWNTAEECQAAIVEGIVQETEEIDYLPWRILIYESSKDRSDMNVHSKITNVVTRVTLEMFGGGD